MAYPIQALEGMSASFTTQLDQLGVRTTEDLLRFGANPEDRAALSERSGVSPYLILRWCHQADLMRVSGVGRQFAELLEASGVNTARRLAEQNPRYLAVRLKAVNQETNLSRNVPAESMVGRWIERASRLEGILRY